jgi:hypothetical protein
MVYEPKSRLPGDSSGEEFTEYARLITQNRESSED